MRECMNRKRLCMLLLFSIAFSLWVSFSYKKPFTFRNIRKPLPRKAIINDTSRQEIEKSIFFLETTGKGILKLRHTSSIESVAYWHPDRKITVYLFPLENTSATQHMIKLEEKYSNLHFDRTKMADFVKGTELDNWFNEGKWRTGASPTAHTSDALRLLILCSSGGLYMDLDIFAQKEFVFQKNALFREDENYLSNGMMSFQKKHPLILQVLTMFVHSYNPGSYAGNGPFLLTSEYKKFISEKGNASDVWVYPRNEMNPITWPNVKNILDDKLTAEVLHSMSKSPAVHWYNYMIRDTAILPNCSCAFMELARRNSPMTYLEIKAKGTA